MVYIYIYIFIAFWLIVVYHCMIHVYMYAALEDHEDLVQCVCWNGSGSMVASVCKVSTYISK